MSDDIQKSRRIYGRGFADGVKSVAVVSVGDVMNQAKLKAIEDSLTGASRKVYEVLEIQKDLTVAEVMQRQHAKGQRPDKSVTEGCLHDLVDRGLARSPIQGRYQRVAASTAPPSVVAQLPIKPSMKPSGDDNPQIPDLSTPYAVMRAFLSQASDLIGEAFGLLEELERNQHQKQAKADKIIAKWNAFKALEDIGDEP